MNNFSLFSKIFFIFVSVLLVTIAIVGWYSLKKTSEAYTQLAYETSQQNATSIKISIESGLLDVPKDLAFATDFYALRRFLTWRAMGEASKANTWKQVFSNTLVDLLETKKDYYQARVIDLDGNEIINAKYFDTLGKTFLIDGNELQNKKGRDYIEKTKLLNKGEFYVSAINLNKEYGKIEKPHIPVIRYATPILGLSKEVIAVFVVNVYAQEILDILEKQSMLDKVKGVSYYLIDKKGDYLYHEDKAKRWSKQLKHSNNFNDDHFDINEAFKNDEDGIFLNNGKIYSFQKIHPLVYSTDKFLYLVSEVNEEVALAKLDEFKVAFFGLNFIIIFISFFLVNFLIKKFTNPIRQVTDQLIALAKGEIQIEEINYTANDEIGQIVQSTQRVVSSMNAIVSQANLVASGDLSKEVELLSKNDQLGLALNSMTRRLKEIETLAINLSKGNYETNILVKSSNDKLGLALLEMIEYLDTITKVAESVSRGEIDLHYKAVGDQDRLGIAMLKMIAYLKTILTQANAIAREDFSYTIKKKSKYDELGVAMVTMTTILSDNFTKNKNEAYFSDGIRELSDVLIGIQTLQKLSEESIATISRYVSAGTGIFYVYKKDDKTLNIDASFAFSPSVNETNIFTLGEGVVGQVGLDKKHILLKNIEPNSYQIHSGSTLGSSKEVFVFPFMHEGKLYGVIEIMSYTKFTKIHLDYLLKAANIVATAFHLTEQNAKIKNLLEKSQAAFEELQSQSEELQESNVQMEEQQQQLTIQSTELKNRNETLAIAKEEIDKRAQDLETASKYKSEFLANMSHELRTPLNSIILLSKLLSQNKNNTLNEKDIEKTNVINKSGNDLLFLINDILDLTKIESGNMELDSGEVNSSEIMDDMHGLFYAVAVDKNISFVVEDNFNSVFITDKSKLSQVIKNLLSNAIKFTNKGSVSISLSKKENSLEILVKDTGIGIPQDKTESIFEAFKQVDGSISREFGGTGLGLSITKTIIDLMQGKIVVQSIHGEGTSFIVTIPLVVPEVTIVDEEQKTVAVINQNFDNDIILINELLGRNILIVDDDSRNIFTLTSILESSGAEVYAAFNGLEAIESLEDDSYSIDLILMDIMMPVMDGLTAIQKIKSDTKFQDIPIIAITAKSTDKDKQECLDAGASEYLSKPIEENELFSMIKAWVR